MVTFSNTIHNFDICLKKYIQCIFIVLLYNITYDAVLNTNGKKYGLFDFSITTDHAGIKKNEK